MDTEGKASGIWIGLCVKGRGEREREEDELLAGTALSPSLHRPCLENSFNEQNPTFSPSSSLLPPSSLTLLRLSVSLRSSLLKPSFVIPASHEWLY